MDFYVPTIGDKIYLTKDWTFKFFKENRNQALAVKLGLDDGTRYYYADQGCFDEAMVLPAKTCLVIDRIYIRKGNPEFDSITFRLAGCPDKRLNKGRFWVKLKDANRIQCQLDPVSDTDAPAAKSSRFIDL